MQLLISYVLRYKKLLFGTLVLATINQIFSLLDPQFFRLMVDRFTTLPEGTPTGTFIGGVLLLLAGSIGVAFISRVAKNFQDYYTNTIMLRVGTSFYTDVIAHAFALPYHVFEDERSGELLQKIRQATDNSKLLIQSFIGTIFVSLIGILFVVAYAFTVHFAMGLAYLLMIPTIGISTFFLGRRIKQVQFAIVRESAILAGSTTETIRNVELVKSLGLEDQEVTRLNVTNQKILDLELKKQQAIRLLSFLQGTLINAIRATLLFLMLWLIFKGHMSVGQLFSLFIYSFYIFSPMQELGTIATRYYETKASLEIVETFLTMQPIAKPTHPVQLENIEKITFSKVSFNYAGAEQDAVTDISFEVTKGETIAFVGPSGSGKTTIIKLLNSLYKPVSGTIKINNTSIEELDSGELRSKVGLVLQETQLFAGTIRDNLQFVDPNATDSECLEALKQAQALPIVERGNLGLDTKIGEGGIKISGGERQRLAIARALLRKPDILIFDEATSALDSITEHAITQTIQTISRSQSHVMKVMVAHRLSTILHADRIYVLEKGRMVESGSHADLLKQKGLYAALWREQGGKV